jgi:hypothetical protein
MPTLAKCSKFIAPIFSEFGGIIKEPDSREQGTMTFLIYRDFHLGITAKHVVGDYELPSLEQNLSLALTKMRPLPGRLVYASPSDPLDGPADLAIFALHGASIVDGGRDFLPEPMAITTLQVGDWCLSKGYPGELRGPHKTRPNVMQHPQVDVAAQCEGVSDRRIRVGAGKARHDKGRFSFGGMSGGPIFKHVTEDDLEFVGMITEGIGPREQCLTEPGVVEETDGILVNGIPITKTILSRLLDHLPEKLLAVQPLRVLRRIHVVDKLPRSGDSDINGK